MDQFDEYIQECLTKSNNALISRQIGRNRPTHLDRWIADGRSDEAVRLCVIKRI